jgi:hypothetical protein
VAVISMLSAPSSNATPIAWCFWSRMSDALLKSFILVSFEIGLPEDAFRTSNR